MIAGEATETPMDRIFEPIDFAVSCRSGAAPDCNRRVFLPSCSSMPAAPLSGIKGFEKSASITIDFRRQRHYV
jgi:hypothetical protein